MIQQFGHYRIDDLSKDFLGQGAMGVVYRAYDDKFSRQVAVKLLRTDPFLPPAKQAQQQKALQRFEREAKMVTKLLHDAIVPVYDFGQATMHGQKYPYMVMRLMLGGSLEKRLEQGALPLEEVVRIISWLAPALDKVHRENIIHRDLKPANILFDEHELPALADFGIAKLTQATQITSSRATPGTPAYMSPELTYAKAYRKAKLDGRSDIYALGAILYEMLTGKYPYHEEPDVPQIMYAHRYKPVPRLDELRTDLGAAWQAVIDKAMAKEPDERYATAGDLVAAALKALISMPRARRAPHVPVIGLPTAEECLRRGNEYYNQKEYEKAIAQYTQAMQLEPNNAYAHLNRGLAYYVLGQPDKAITDYNQAAHLNAQSATTFYYRGLAYQYKGQLDEAISDYDQALRINPQYSDVTSTRQAAYDALLKRTQSAYQQGRLSEAIADCTTLLGFNARDVSVLLLRGQAYEKQGQLSEAIADYDEALRINPNHAEAKRCRANVVDEALLKDEARLKKLPAKQRIAAYVSLFNHDSLLASLPPTRRAEIGVDLAKLGDPRKEIMTVEGMLFCYVPPGAFWMGSDEKDDTKPQHQLDIPYGYWMSRDLISNAQFEQFVKAGGYKREKYWAEAKAAGVWKSGQVKDWYDSNWRSAPRDFGEPFTLPNHPVVGVMWYEALAFTRWLTEQLGSQMGLPSEAEWEKAARGGLMIPATPLIRPATALSVPQGLTMMSNPLPQRRYPWGDDVEAGHTNSKEAGIGKTSALGAFPQDKSPYGCQEMAGNVWEWTRSLYQPYPYQLDDKRENLAASIDTVRVLRASASFYNSTIGVGCFSRYRSSPDSRYDDGGFRVVRPPFL